MSALFVTAAVAGVFPLSGFVVAAIVVSAIAALAVAQFVIERRRPAGVPPDIRRSED